MIMDYIGMRMENGIGKKKNKKNLLKLKYV